MSFTPTPTPTSPITKPSEDAPAAATKGEGHESNSRPVQCICSRPWQREPMVQCTVSAAAAAAVTAVPATAAPACLMLRVLDD